MNRFVNHAFASAFAFTFSLCSIGAIVTVPPAQAQTPAVLAMPEIA